MMKSLADSLSPGVTDMIRMDHAHVMASFHRYDADAGEQTRKALVDAICLALDIHAQLEEEIFYPLLREASGDDTVISKNIPEHDEMRRLIAQLRGMPPSAPGYNDTFMQLMRDVLHHVADEETTQLPEAERLLADRLGALGAQWTRRRLQLSAPHAGEIAVNTVRGFPASAMLVAAGAVLAGTYFARRAFEGQSQHRRHHH